MAQEDDILNQNFQANAGGGNNSLANQSKKLSMKTLISENFVIKINKTVVPI